MTPLTALRNIRALLADPAHWTQGTNARDADGFPVDPIDDSAATAWCLQGAMYRGSGGADTLSVRAALADQLSAFYCLTNWNDTATRTHAEVLALIDRALAAQGAVVAQEGGAS